MIHIITYLLGKVVGKLRALESHISGVRKRERKISLKNVLKLPHLQVNESSIPFLKLGKRSVSLFQQEPLPVRVAHGASLLSVLRLEPTDGSMQHIDPHLALL